MDRVTLNHLNELDWFAKHLEVRQLLVIQHDDSPSVIVYPTLPERSHP